MGILEGLRMGDVGRWGGGGWRSLAGGGEGREVVEEG